MRKRNQYKTPGDSAAKKIPTIILMILLLVGILAYGKTLSSRVAAIFAPNEPSIDTPAAAHAPTGGTQLSHAYRTAAQSLLPLLSRGHTPQPYQAPTQP